MNRGVVLHLSWGSVCETGTEYPSTPIDCTGAPALPRLHETLGGLPQTTSPLSVVVLAVALCPSPVLAQSVTEGFDGITNLPAPADSAVMVFRRCRWTIMATQPTHHRRLRRDQLSADAAVVGIGRPVAATGRVAPRAGAWWSGR